MGNQRLCQCDCWPYFLAASAASSWGQSSDAGSVFRARRRRLVLVRAGAGIRAGTRPSTPHRRWPSRIQSAVTDSPVVEEIDPVDPKPLSAAWFRANLDDYRDRALDDPSPDNVEAYLYLQRIALERAGSFAEASAAAAVKDPWLDANSERPIATYAAQAIDAQAETARTTVLSELAKDAGILFLLSSRLPALRQPGGCPEARQRPPWFRGHGGFPGCLTAVRRSGRRTASRSRPGRDPGRGGPSRDLPDPAARPHRTDRPGAFGSQNAGSAHHRSGPCRRSHSR